MKVKAIIKLILVHSLTSGMAASAQETYLPNFNVKERIAELDNRPAGLLSTSTHQRLQRVHAHLQNKNYKEASSLLEGLKDAAKSRPVELAQILQTMGFVAIEAENYKLAIQHFKAALDLKALPRGPTMNTLYTLAQLYLSEQKFNESLAYLLRWFSYSEGPGSEAYALLANVYAQQNKKQAAFANIEQAIKVGQNVSKSWLQLAVALAFELNHYDSAAKHLKTLTARHPEEKQYWKQLAGVYLNLEKPKEALATMELAQKAGHLTEESEIINLVSLYLNRGIPYWGAQALQQSLDNKIIKPTQKSMYLLAQCYIQAEELDKALEPLEQAAQFSPDGKLYVLQGQIYLEKEKWKNAASSFQKALTKGGLKDDGLANLGLGMAYVELNKPLEAKQAFEQAKQVATTKTAAEQWLQGLK